MIIRFEKSWPNLSWDVYAFDQTPQGRVAYRVTVEKMPPMQNGLIMEPAVRVPMEDQRDLIHALLDGLTEAGLIPKMGATEAELVATKRHLDDLRALTFDDIRPKQL